jgi:hypothetical protein
MPIFRQKKLKKTRPIRPAIVRKLFICIKIFVTGFLEFILRFQFRVIVATTEKFQRMRISISEKALIKA